MTVFQLLRTPLIAETPFAMKRFSQMAVYIQTTVAAVIVAPSGSAAGLSGAMLAPGHTTTEMTATVTFYRSHYMFRNANVALS